MVDKFAMFGAVVLTAVVVIGMWAWYSRARGADLLPIEITQGHSQGRGPSMSLDKFGHYSMRYYRKRWVYLCSGGGRYVAMAEAYDMHQPNPCQ